MKKLFMAIFYSALLLGGSALAQQRLQTGTLEAKPDPNANLTQFQYTFVNERFTIPRIEVEFDGTGAGQYLFKRKDADEIVNKLTVSASLINQMQALFSALNFLDSTEEYQHKKDFSHLGTMTIRYAHNGKERTTRFNYTDNAALARLAELFRGIATQEMRVFEIENTRQTDPISTPAQMRMLESELRGKHLADPYQLIPLLKDVIKDEGVPLIARNHAERLIQLIQKTK
ncbi:MAG: hypothetical protein HYR56_30590 [Acidobacteria bacterium]|nr:hypothetical protein [Acidobacteriota bacterium]MBI3427875.1 hypothetical protein [Acidobacteriota bacterium]